MTAADVADLIASGHRMCSCGAVLQPSAAVCRFCGAVLVDETKASEKAKTPAASRKPKPVPFNPDAGRGKHGSLADLPEQTLTLVVSGTPVPQGSLIAVAPGVIRRESGPELVAWRDSITQAALRTCGSGWVPANAAVRVDVTLTVPRPSGAPKTRAVPADGYRDLDKLVRAIGDALCPDSPERFRVLASDMRIVTTTSAKTHPRPMHTDPWALDAPGAVIRVSTYQPDADALSTPAPTSTHVRSAT